MTGLNGFMNALWNAEGKQVTGTYQGKPFLGVIVYTRLQFGNDISVKIENEDGETFLTTGTKLHNELLDQGWHVYF